MTSVAVQPRSSAWRRPCSPRRASAMACHRLVGRARRHRVPAEVPYGLFALVDTSRRGYFDHGGRRSGNAPAAPSAAWPRPYRGGLPAWPRWRWLGRTRPWRRWPALMVLTACNVGQDGDGLPAHDSDPRKCHMGRPSSWPRPPVVQSVSTLLPVLLQAGVFVAPVRSFCQASPHRFLCCRALVGPAPLVDRIVFEPSSSVDAVQALTAAGSAGALSLPPIGFFVFSDSRQTRRCV